MSSSDFRLDTRACRALLVDGVLEGSWGSWAIEVKTGAVQESDLRGLLEFNRRFPKYKPLLVGDASEALVRRAGVAATSWAEFLISGPP